MNSRIRTPFYIFFLNPDYVAARSLLGHSRFENVQYSSFCAFGHSLLEPEIYVLIGLQAQVKLTCCNQRWVVQKLVNAKPGLKVDQSIKFSRIQIIFTGFVFYRLRKFKLKHKAKQCKYNLTEKLQNLNGALNNPAGELRF